MTFWNSFLSLFGADDVASPFGADSFGEVGAINPATGLPMVSGSTAGFDVGGNLYGIDNHAFDNSLTSSSDLFSTSLTDACCGGDSFGSAVSFDDF